jgi:hypothetical protein
VAAAIRHFRREFEEMVKQPAMPAGQAQPAG